MTTSRGLSRTYVRGFVSLGLILLLVAGFAGVGWYFAQQGPVPPSRPATTADIRYTMVTVNGEYEVPLVVGFPDKEVEDKVNRELEEIGNSWGCDAGARVNEFDAGARVKYVANGIFSLDTSYSGYCGGPYPFYGQVGFTFDMTTGQSVPFESLFANYERDKSAILASIIADMLATRAARSEARGDDPKKDECVDAYRRAGMGIEYYVAPDGLHLISTFPHVAQACIEEIVKPAQAFSKYFDETSILSRIR